MATTRKPNGRDLLDYREANDLINRTKEDLARQIHTVMMKLDSIDVQGTRGAQVIEGRVGGLEKRFDDIDDKVASLELSRAEGKGRAAVVGGIVAFIVGLIMALLGFALNRIPQGSPDSVPTPNVFVTVLPQSGSLQSRPTVLRILIPGPGGTASPQPSSSPTPGVSPTPTASPTPNLIDDTCQLIRDLGLACQPQPAPAGRTSNGLLAVPVMLALRLLRRLGR